MRVLIANNYFYLRGGAERVMFNDMRALAEAGAEIVPFSAADPANAPTEYAKYFAEGADIHATGALQRVRAAYEAIHCQRAADAFDRLIRDAQPDIVHFHNIYGRLSTSLFSVAERRGIPSVLTLHDYKVVCPSYLMLNDGQPCDSCLDGGFWRCALNRCHKGNVAASAVYSVEAYVSRLGGRYDAVSAFLCPSRFMETLLTRFGVAGDRIIYHPNAVDPAAYTPSYEGDYALYLGRLSHEKGLPTLLRAMAGTGVPLRIAGSGPMEQTVRDLADAGQDPIVLEGHCEGERLRDLCRNAAFVVVPSEWYENAPMSVIEAFAYGKPVVATSIGGNPELVIDGETGYLVDCRNPRQLQAVITELWRDKAGRQRMGRQARELVETRLSQKVRTASLLAIYENLRHSGSAFEKASGRLAAA